MAKEFFDSLADLLENVTDLDRLEARGTLRIVLKEAGLRASTVSGEQFSVAIRALLPVELASRGISDVDRICDQLVRAADEAGGEPAADNSPEAMFGRLGE